jgi:hypothetical protein
MNNMTYEKYKNSQVVKGFMNHFNVNSVIKGKSHWCPRYKGRKEFQFEIKEFSESIDKYSWPSSFLAPEDSYGYFENGKEVKCESWLETKKCLQSLSKGLKKSLDSQDEKSILQWCDSILSWGMGGRKLSTMNKLDNLSDKEELNSYLQNIRKITDNKNATLMNMVQLFEAATKDVNVSGWMSSGLSKVIALLSDKIIILDSRVGAIFCEYINDYLNENQINSIPSELRFGWADGPKSTRRKPLPLTNGENHSSFSRDSTWYEKQVRASWLIQAILEKNSDIFKDEGGMIERIHAFEASLFMLGYNLNNTSKEEYKNITQNKSVVEVKKTNKKSEKTKPVSRGKINNQDRLFNHLQEHPSSLEKRFNYTNLVQLAESVIPITTPTGKAYASLRFIQDYCSIVKGDIHTFDHFKELSDPRKFSSLVELKNDWQFKLD